MKLWMMLALLGLVVTGARAQNAPPAPVSRQIAPPLLLRTDYVEGEDGWQVFGTGAKLARVSDEETKKNALKFGYTLAKDGIAAMILPVSENEIGTARSFRFSVKASQATTLAAGIQEQGGGRYIALFHAPANKWQTVTLGASDFVLMEGPNDPKDPNGKLDLNQIQALAITDITQLLMQGDTELAKKLFGVTPGTRSLTVGEFTVSTESLPSASFFSPADARLDTFAHPQVGWLALGGAMLERATGGPLTVSGLKMTYKQEAGKLNGIARQIPRGRLAGHDKLVVSVASEKPAVFLVQLEERSGGKYNYPVTLEGKKSGESLTARELVFPFADFKPSEDSKDPNNKLDLSDVYQILLIDVSGLLGTAKGEDNMLYLGGLRIPVTGAGGK